MDFIFNLTKSLKKKQQTTNVNVKSHRKYSLFCYTHFINELNKQMR